MRSFNLLDLSGAVQPATSHLLRKRQEVYDSKNAVYNQTIGSAVRRPGYEVVGLPEGIVYGNDSLYGGIYRYGVNNKIIVGINTADNSGGQLLYFDSDNYYKPILTNAEPNTRFQCLNYLKELYVAGRAGTGKYQPLTNVDYTLTPSTTRNVLNAPACRFIAQYGGSLYAINCQVNGVIYRDRAYKSSPAMGAITFVQTDQSGPLTQLKVDSVRYLKVGMTIDIYGAGTEVKKVNALTIVSVDKNQNKIGFSSQQITVSDNDEVWLTGRKGQLTIFWNTDYPTPESSDWIKLPNGDDENAEFTGWTVNNNRLLLFSRNSLLKWDGQNLIVLSPTVGTVSHESISNIGPWTFWLHTSGVWGYNDNTGQVKHISQAIAPLIKRINPSSLSRASSVAIDRVYKLSVGQLLDPILATTSTSTSSTSTSSTSSSTSSTSTSSTSTSVTTTSISRSTTSVSTTSSSTSSTSVSTTSQSTSTSISSTSSSTSTSSTSTTTVATTKTTVRLCYDYNLNIWWYEEHNREQRFQFTHTMNGFTKPYFTDENGYLFRDETGSTDFGRSISMQIETGRTNCGTEQQKTWMALQVDSEKARGSIIQYALDGSDEWRSFEGVQLTDDIQTIAFPQNEKLVQSRDINIRIVHNDYGEAPVVNGMTIYFNVVESLVNEIGEFAK